jgi:hypothetical protein
LLESTLVYKFQEPTTKVSRENRGEKCHCAWQLVNPVTAGHYLKALKNARQNTMSQVVFLSVIDGMSSAKPI